MCIRDRPKAGCLLSAPEGTPDDVLRMAKNLIEALVQLSATSGGIGSAYQRILLNELSVAELDAAISEYRIPAQLSRCVLLLHMIPVSYTHLRWLPCAQPQAGFPQAWDTPQRP